MAKPQRQQDPDIELESEPIILPPAPDTDPPPDGPLEGVAHKRRNDSPEAVALRMHRERRELTRRLVAAERRHEEANAALNEHLEYCLSLTEETQKLLDRLVAP